jgi:hypothetical protein
VYAQSEEQSPHVSPSNPTLRPAQVDPMRRGVRFVRRSMSSPPPSVVSMEELMRVTLPAWIPVEPPITTLDSAVTRFAAIAWNAAEISDSLIRNDRTCAIPTLTAPNVDRSTIAEVDIMSRDRIASQ